MCTQDITVYRCSHHNTGELHPCKNKQERPNETCMWEIVRRLDLHQQCKKCTTKTIGKRSDSDWSYTNNNEYQRAAGNTKDERKKERRSLIDISTNFEVKQAIQERRLEEQDSAQDCSIKPLRSAGPELFRAVARYAYRSEQKKDCNFEKGHHIAIFHSIGQSLWWGVNLETMSRGILPKSYVQLLYDSIPSSPPPPPSPPEIGLFPLYDNGFGDGLLDYVNAEVGE